eukprot:gene6325-6977_t
MMCCKCSISIKFNRRNRKVLFSLVVVSLFLSTALGATATYCLASFRSPPLPNSLYYSLVLLVCCTVLFFLLVAFITAQSGWLQTKRLPRGDCCSGRRINQSALLFLSLALIYCILVCLATVRVGRELSSSLRAEDNHLPPIEKSLARLFDSVFFAAARSCRSEVDWFWLWVNACCPSSLSSTSCRACPQSAFTFCAADASRCAFDGPDSAACPYTLCRSAVLRHASRLCKIGFVVAAVFFLAHLLMWCSNVLLIGYQFRSTSVVRVLPVQVTSQYQHQ